MNAKTFIQLSRVGGMLSLLLLASSVSAMTFTVNSTSDSATPPLGVVTLRSALQGVNQSCGVLNNINFAIPASDPNFKTVMDSHSNSYSYWSIKPTSALPQINCPVVIDGFSQSGAGVHAIELSGELIPANAPAPGLLFVGKNTDGTPLASGKSPNGSTIRGLMINKFPQQGVYVYGADNFTIVGNYFGLDATGTESGFENGHEPNAFSPYDSLRMEASNNNFIGTIQSDFKQNKIDNLNRNVFGSSGQGSMSLVSLNQNPGGFGGINAIPNSLIGSSQNVVQDNYFGTDKTGTVLLGHLANDGFSTGTGVYLDGTGSKNNVIGGPNPSMKNIMMGISFAGIFSGGASGTQIIGNSINTYGLGAIFVVGNSNSKVSANSVANSIYQIAAVYLLADQNTTMANNIIDGGLSATGIFVSDVVFGLFGYSGSSSNGLINDNQINNTYPGIILDNGLSGYTLRNNSFISSVSVDMYLCGSVGNFFCSGNTPLPSSNNTVIANNFASTVADFGVNNKLLGTLNLVNNPNVPAGVKNMLISNSVGKPQ